MEVGRSHALDSLPGDSKVRLSAIWNQAKTLATVCVACMLIGLSNEALTKERRTIDVPKEIVQQIVQDRDYGESIVLKADGMAENLVAIPTDLNHDGKPEMIVHGINTGGIDNICGANNCITWVYGRVASGYKLFLYADVIQNVEPQKTYTNGYREIITSGHGSAFYSYLKLYKFNGNDYRLKACFERRFEVSLDSKERERVAKHPRIRPVKCKS